MMQNREWKEVEKRVKNSVELSRWGSISVKKYIGHLRLVVKVIRVFMVSGRFRHENTIH